MAVGRLLMLVAWTFALPGAGQGAAGRRTAAMMWAAAGMVAALATLWTIWALPVAVAVRVASAGEAAVRLRRFDGRREDRNWPLYASLVGVFGFVVFMFGTERFDIPSASMMPAIAVGDSVLVETASKAWRLPARGEIVVFDHPCEPRAHIKRVVGIAGDTVEVRCRQLYVNGTAVSRGTTETLADPPHATVAGSDAKDFPALDGLVRGCAGQPGRGTIVVTKPDAAGCEPQKHFVVPPATIFVLGDNRAEANDSRAWGVVPVANVTGRALGIAWPLARFGALR